MSSMEYVLNSLCESVKVEKVANVHFFEFPKDFYTNPEKHPFYEIIFVSSGALDINAEGYTGRIYKNQMMIHRPNETHSLTCDAAASPTVIIIGFTCSYSGLDVFSHAPITLTYPEIKKLAEIVKEGRNLFMPPYGVPLLEMKKKKNPPFASEQMLKILIEYFLISATRRVAFSSETDSVKDEQKISAGEIAAYLKENFTEKITIDELAFLFRTNRSTLCKEFKNFTGKSVVEFLNDVKITEAKKRIRNTDKTFTEISEELNFDSVHYFTRLFKSSTGMTPKEYRKRKEKV